MPPRPHPDPPRTAVLFDTAGFVRSLPLTGAAARTKHLTAHLHATGAPTRLLLCDLNPDSAPTSAWPMPVDYIDYATCYEHPTRLAERLRATGTDVLVMSSTELVVRHGRALAQAADCALVYEMHDDEAAVAATTGADRMAVFDAGQLQQAATAAADAVIAFTARDAATARARGAANVHVVPCGITPGPRPETAEHTRIRGRIVFVGNLYYEPNRRAVRYLHRVLAPALAPLGATIDVYGRYPADLRTELADSLVRLRGPVPDLRTALSQAAVGVAPLDSGGGMKLKVLEYMAAGLATVGTPEAFAGTPGADEWALVCRADMSDLPALAAGVLKSEEIRADLAERARRRAETTYAWDTIAEQARAALAAVRPASRPAPPVSVHVAAAAHRSPYWLAEWRARGARAATDDKEQQVGDYTTASARGIVAERAEAIDCARISAGAELDAPFDAEGALVGYGERSVLFFADDAVLKVYTHRPGERMRREVAGLRAAAARPHLRVPEVLGFADAPGALAWLAMGRLEGAEAAELDSAQASEDIARVAARLHTTPMPALTAAGMPEYTLRLRAEPVDHAEAEHARTCLAEALAPIEATELDRCTRGLVHGDFSARNILLAADDQDAAPGVIDFEGCGIGCVYEDLAKLHLNEVHIAGRDEALLAKAYAEEALAQDSAHPTVDPDHLHVHLARHLRWVLQWAPAIDAELTGHVLGLVPQVVASLPAAR